MLSLAPLDAAMLSLSLLGVACLGAVLAVAVSYLAFEDLTLALFAAPAGAFAAAGAFLLFGLR